LSGASLPARILEHLESNGPNYGTALAVELGAAPAAVAGALTSLRRRGAVTATREGRRVLYAADVAAFTPRDDEPSPLDPLYARVAAASIALNGGGDAELERALHAVAATAAEIAAAIGERKAGTAECPRAPGSKRPGLLARLDDELALLRLEQHIALGGVDPAVAEVLYDSAGEPARHRRAA
jgi:DNA-binding transcriptional ArsR family regulator